MAGNLGSYSITLSANYSGMTKAVEAAMKAIIDKTQNATNAVTKMSEQIDRSMQGVSASMTNAATKIGEQSDVINQKLSTVGKGMAKNPLGDAGSYDRHVSGFNKVGSAIEKANKSGSVLTDTIRKIGHHIEWMAAATATVGILGVPLGVSMVSRETEMLDQKIRQNLELSDKYHNNSQLLESDMKKLRDVQNAYAIGYGQSIGQVQEAMQIISRRFKEVEEISYLTSVALTMNKMDFVNLKDAASNLEAVMLQYGLTAQGTQQFLNDFTVAVHTARITGTELMDALQRSGSAFQAFGMSTRESIAAVAALSTETARTGSTIGQSFKSIATNFDLKKATEALKTYGIELYTTNENGTKTIRNGANVFQELQRLFQRLDDEGKRKLAYSLAGGKFQVNALMAFLTDANQNFSKIMDEMKNKSSNEMTKELLKLSLGTYDTKIMQMKASWEVLARTIGEQVLPAMKSLMERLTAMALWLTENSDKVIAFAKSIAILAGAYAASRLVLMAYRTALYGVIAAQAISAALSAFSAGAVSLETTSLLARNAANIAATASTALAIAKTQGLAAALKALSAAGLGLGIIAIKIVAVVAALAALSYAIYYVYTNWEDVCRKLSILWNEFVQYVADNISTILAVFPLLGAAVIGVSAAWENWSQNVKAIWTFVVNVVSTCAVAIYRFIVAAGEAFGPFVEAAKKGIANFASIIGDLVSRIMPSFVTDFLRWLGVLGDKAAAMTAEIGNTIRRNLTVTVNPIDSNVDRKKKDPESLTDKAIQMSDDWFEKILGKGLLGGNGKGKIPDLTNLLGSDSGKGSETAYRKAVAAYEAEAAKREADAAIAGFKYTQAEKLALMHQYLDDVEKLEDDKHHEQTDWKKRSYTEQLKATEEEISLRSAALKRLLAEEKASKRDEFAEELRIQDLVIKTKLKGSEEELRELTKRAEIVKKSADYEMEVAKKSREIAQTEAKEKQALANLAIEQAAKLGLITNSQKIQFQQGANRTSYQEQVSGFRGQVGAQATKGNESALLAAYEQYINAVNELDRQQAEVKMQKLSQNYLKTQDTLNKELQARSDYVQKSKQLENELYNEAHRYQISFVNGLKSGITNAFDAIIDRTQTVGQAISNMFKSVVKAIGNTFANDMAQRWTSALTKMLFKTKSTTQQTSSLWQQGSVVQQQASYGAAAVQEQMNNAIATGFAQMCNMKVVTNQTANTTIQNSDKLTQATTMASIGSMMMQMLALLAVMLVVSALFGGGGSSESKSTASVSLGRNPDSYYSTPSAISIPSFDVGAMYVPEDMLANIHKGEMIVPAGFADSVRNMISGNSTTTNQSGRSPVYVNASAIDGRGMKQVLTKASEDMVGALQKAARRRNLKTR